MDVFLFNQRRSSREGIQEPRVADRDDHVAVKLRLGGCKK
jgi:hypothetical protein